MEGETSARGSASRGRGRGTALAPQTLRRSLLESMPSPPTSEVPRGRGGRTKKTGRGGKAGGGHGRGRRTAAPSSPPPMADSPEHTVDPSSETPVQQPTPVFLEESTSTRTTWSPWADQPEQQMPEGEVGAEGPVDTDDEDDVAAEGTTVYQRGGTRLPPEPVTPAHKALITPDGEA